jgi:hypothetical protein
VKRSDWQEAAQHAQAVCDNENRSDASRAKAEVMFAKCSEVITYTNDPDKRIRLPRAAFWVRNFYRDMVAELLERLAGDVVADHRAQVIMTGKMVEIVDNPSYSTDFRLDALESLDAVLLSLEPPTLTVVKG